MAYNFKAIKYCNFPQNVEAHLTNFVWKEKRTTQQKKKEEEEEQWDTNLTKNKFQYHFK